MWMDPFLWAKSILFLSYFHPIHIYLWDSCQLNWRGQLGQYLQRAGYLVQPEPNLCLLLTDKNLYTTHTGIWTIESDIEVEPGGIGANLMQQKVCKFPDCIWDTDKTICCCNLKSGCKWNFKHLRWGLWPALIVGAIWPPFSRYLPIFSWYLAAIFAIFWQFLATFVTFWQLLAFGRTHKLLTTFMNFSSLWSTFGHFCHFLAIFGNFGKITVYGIPEILFLTMIYDISVMHFALLIYHTWYKRDFRKNTEIFANKIC